MGLESFLYDLRVEDCQPHLNTKLNKAENTDLFNRVSSLYTYYAMLIVNKTGHILTRNVPLKYVEYIYRGII